jgi:N-acetylglucosamine-6-phosphate deacetylase
MRIERVKYYGADFGFHYGDIEIGDGRFTRIVPRDTPAPPDADLLIPGLIDIHLHGNSGADFSDGAYDGLLRMARFLAGAGTTSFSPATMTLPEDDLAAAARTAVRLRDEQPAGCAAIRGITMEGPFFNANKKGAQNAAYLRTPDIALFRRLQEAADGMIRLACLAPELPGAVEYIRAVRDTGVTVAAAHTEADYDQAAVGFDAGISHVTHLFNAMPPLLHRSPGIIGAAAEREDVTVELICDGIHIHPSAVRAAFRLFGPERICLVSDAMAACGMGDGETMLGGQAVTVRGGTATLPDGTLAGSVATLFDCVRRAISFGIPAEDALRCATSNPARVLGARDIGSIAVGYTADCLLCGSDWTLKEVILRGERPSEL